ncbi:MAG: hypothetical protein R2734_21035 [Nocardioides sp.]
MTWFDEGRLDDARALASADLVLRSLAESGARVRREAHDADAALQEAVVRAREQDRPRAVVAAGPDSRLLRAVLEPWCPVPFVAWPAAGLPGWAGGMDLVVVLAPSGTDSGAASAAAESRPPGLPGGRRGACSLPGGRARGRPLDDAAADEHRRPAGDGRGDAGAAGPGRPRPARRCGERRDGAGRGGRGVLTASRPRGEPRPRCSRSRWPTPFPSCGAARCWRREPRGGRRVDPAGVGTLRAGRRR